MDKQELEEIVREWMLHGTQELITDDEIFAARILYSPEVVQSLLLLVNVHRAIVEAFIAGLKFQKYLSRIEIASDSLNDLLKDINFERNDDEQV